LNLMDWQIMDANEGAGLIIASKQTSGLFTELLTQSTTSDVLSVTVFRNPGTGQTNIRAVASSTQNRDALNTSAFQRGSSQLPPSKSGQEAAQTLLAACGVTDIAGPSSGTFEGTTDL